MPSFKRKRPKIGDVIEIRTPKGFVYVQYVKNPMDVIRVLPGLYPNPLSPSEIRELVQKKERFITYMCPDLLMDKEIWDWETKIVAHEEVPEHARFVRLWRRRIPIGPNKYEWVLVMIDERGEEQIRPATELTPEEFWKLPVTVFFGQDSLKEMLMDPEWTWEKERDMAVDPFREGEELPEGMKEEKEFEEERVKEIEIEQNLPFVVHYFLYFPKKKQVEAFVSELKKKGKDYKILVRKGYGEYSVVVINWFFVDEEFFEKIEGLEEELEELAEKFGGELDGHEIGLVPGKDPLYEDYKGEGTTS